MGLRGALGEASTVAPAHSATPERSSRASRAPRPSAQTARRVLSGATTTTAWAVLGAIHLATAGLLFGQVIVGSAEFAAVGALVAGMVVCDLLALLAIRRDVRWGDEPLRVEAVQAVLAVAVLCATYAIAGPLAPASVIVLAAHLGLAAFTEPLDRVRTLAVLALGGLAVTMVVSWWSAPDRYPGGAQVITFGYALGAVIVVGFAGHHLDQLHRALDDQRIDLDAAQSRIRTLTTIDPVSGVSNRRHVMERMRAEELRHHRIADPVCVALVEIDRFATIDPQFGRGAGDELLRRFAIDAQTSLRTTDLIGRWENDQFVVMLTHTPLDRAMIAIQRLREHLRLVDLSDVAGAFEITVSVGLASVRMNDGLLHALDRADQSLFLARTGGRDRVECDNLPCA